MQLYIMAEPKYENTTSCELVLKGLKDNLRKKRISYKVVDDIAKIEVGDKKTFLFLISTNKSFIAKTISKCETKKIHPIIISLQLINSIPGIYSSVTANIEHSMFKIMNYLKNIQKTQPALYGISVNSAPDVARQNCFLQKHILPTSENDVFYNHIGLDDCFNNFFANIEKYDCIICTNNYAAIHLINNLKERGCYNNDLTVISYGKTLLTTKFYPEIIPVYVSNESLGRTALTVFEQLQNDTDILHINASVKCDIFNESTVISEPFVETNDIFEESEPDIFYEDPYIQNMLLVEKLLSTCDATDALILDSVLSGDSYDEIANKSFLSNSAVKYRVKNMLQSCNCSTKSEFIHFMKKYMQE